MWDPRGTRQVCELEGTQKGWPQAQPCPHPIVPFGTNVCTHRGSVSLKPGLKTLFQDSKHTQLLGLDNFWQENKKERAVLLVKTCAFMKCFLGRLAQVPPRATSAAPCPGRAAQTPLKHLSCSREGWSSSWAVTQPFCTSLGAKPPFLTPSRGVG